MRTPMKYLKKFSIIPLGSFQRFTLKLGLFIFILGLGLIVISQNKKDALAVSRVAEEMKTELTEDRKTELLRYMNAKLGTKEEITVVTAFFDIGSFHKNNCTRFHCLTVTVDTYFGWARSFKYMLNSLVVYTDSKIFTEYMLHMRSGMLERTKIFRIDRNSSWAFNVTKKVKKIYNTEGYPKYFPNTVVPEYACVQHAKYDVLSRAAKENYFKTDNFAWLDIGYFRDEVSNINYYFLQKPPNFNSSRIAVNLVNSQPLNVEPSKIFKTNTVWIGGGLIFGKRDKIILFEKSYIKALDYFLSQNLMNTDQQLIYAMFSQSGRKEIEPEVDLQLYYDTWWKRLIFNQWFYLGYQMRHNVNQI